jgi:hypothetical protein
MPVLREPVSLERRRALRTAVLLLAQSDRRRHVPPQLHVGTPGGRTTTIDHDPDWDHGLRTEVVGAALRAGHDPPYVWLTRSGPLTLADPDAAWLGPCVAAASERDHDVIFVVVTRHGWRDPRSGLSQEWTRIRSR